MQMTLVAIFTLVLAVGISYMYRITQKWERERSVREKKAEEIKIATKLGVAVDKIVSKSLFFFGSFVLHFLPGGFVLY